MPYLPITKEEAGGTLDFIMVSGDAYIDHPSFGHAVIARYVESFGYRVGVIAQPQNDEDFQRLGEPKCGFLVSPGVVDSMVNNYTAAKKKRTNDEYSPGNEGFRRPDRALTVYCKALKRLYPNVPVIAGGIEGSLRRFAHYDYWEDCVLPSVLNDCPCDLLIYGSGEKPFSDILTAYGRGIPLAKIRDVRGTCYIDTFDGLSTAIKASLEGKGNYLVLDSFAKVSQDKVAYAKTFRTQSRNCDYFSAKGLIQEQKDKRFLVQNPPQKPLTTEELDFVYQLPFMRGYHPSYEAKGGVKAIEEVKFSITSHRGCFGSCSFCALNYHNGRVIQKRSEESILEEVALFTQDPDFKGYVHDVGGPTANFRNPACEKQMKSGVCVDRPCIGNQPCPHLRVDHREYVELLKKVRRVPGVKKVFIRSGVRFDYVMYDKNEQFFDELCKYYVSGQLKTAPEHASNEVLRLMNKPKFEVYRAFADRFAEKCKKLKLKQYIVPYFISSHPGCTIKEALKLTLYLKSINYMPRQVQDFYPTPSTRSTCMYYTGIDPETMQEVYVPKGEEKEIQRALLQWRKKENFPLVRKALRLCGREDLIGTGPNALVPPEESVRYTRFRDKQKAQTGKAHKRTK